MRNLIKNSKIYNNFYEKQIRKRLMFVIYNILINLILLISPIIILARLIKKKEDKFRFKEKFCFFSKKRLQVEKYYGFMVQA